MGFCSKRRFLLTICTLQLITTVERQVFDYLGFMWVPILLNSLNIIFVIFGFFGAYQYRTKYLISYCVWDTLWLGWNIFCICYYLEIGPLDKNGDILNLGSGSISWWHENGPGCKAVYDVTERGFFPTNVTDCILSYEVVEVMHASTQCILAFVAIVGGICLSRSFMEEDDSFDFVGGGDFGLAGHTPLHPMYVSYSALPPSAFPQSNQNYQSYSRGTNGSNNSSSYYRDNTTLPKIVEKSVSNLTQCHDTTRSSASTRIIDNIDYYNDYSNPVDHLHRPISPLGEYDSLESSAKFRFEKNQAHQVPARCYSPVVSPVMRRARPSQASKQNRNSYKPRVFTDHIRDQPLRSFYSDPRLAMEQQQQQQQQQQNTIESIRRENRSSRPLSMYASKL